MHTLLHTSNNGACGRRKFSPEMLWGYSKRIVNFSCKKREFHLRGNNFVTMWDQSYTYALYEKCGLV